MFFCVWLPPRKSGCPIATNDSVLVGTLRFWQPLGGGSQTEENIQKYSENLPKFLGLTSLLGIFGPHLFQY